MENNQQFIQDRFRQGLNGGEAGLEPVCSDQAKEIESLQRTSNLQRQKACSDLRRKINKQSERDIVEKIISGKSQAQIAADLGVSQQRVSQIVRKLYRDENKAEIARKVESFVGISEIEILCGDCLDLIDKIKDQSVSLFITDPLAVSHQNDIYRFEKCLGMLIPKFKEEFQGFVFCDPAYSMEVETLIKKFHTIKSRIIWEKTNSFLGKTANDRFDSSYGVIFHFGNGPLHFQDKRGIDRLDILKPKVSQNNFNSMKIRSIKKPMDLIKNLVSLGSREGDLVLDSFAGDGDAGVACLELKRRCILIEKEAGLIEVIRRRLKHTGNIEGYITFLMQWDWEWYCHLTFRKRIHPEQADKNFRAFISEIETMGGLHDIDWARVTEFQRRKVIHYHAFLRNIKNPNPNLWMAKWNEIAGEADIEAPRDIRASIAYAAKYLGQGGGLDFSESLKLRNGDKPTAPKWPVINWPETIAPEH